MGNDPYMPLWNMMFGVAAAGAIVILAILIFKLAIFIGDKIANRYEKPDPSVAVKSGLMSPNEVRLHHGYPKAVLPDKATKPKKPHRHMWRFQMKYEGLEYRFTCECGDISATPIDQFWGSPTIRSERALKRADLLYANKKAYQKEHARAIKAFRDYSW